MILLPVRKPPFYAVLGRQGFDTTLGGIRINHLTEIISRQDSPIKGLYTVGDCANGWISSITKDIIQSLQTAALIPSRIKINK